MIEECYVVKSCINIFNRDSSNDNSAQDIG